ncbi:MAG: Hsp20/alpha crystallin family protein [Anaerolineales bacterium]|nr:Hsp20/alpha crystallin family protein [Anaerolineales bacterium]
MNEQHPGTNAPALLYGAEDDSWRLPSESGGVWKARRGAHIWRPPTDVFERDDAYVVMVEVAGMRGGEFAVNLENRLLWIRGTRSDTAVTKAYHQMEIAYGEFETAVGIPAPVDAARIEAVYTDGFLRVMLPKSSPKSVRITG